MKTNEEKHDDFMKWIDNITFDIKNDFLGQNKESVNNLLKDNNIKTI
jgi:hypothetical protein